MSKRQEGPAVACGPQKPHTTRHAAFALPVVRRTEDIVQLTTQITAAAAAMYIHTVLPAGMPCNAMVQMLFSRPDARPAS